jgi:sarcosine oxidase subunit delta
MMQIACPWCGSRPEAEFDWAALASVARPPLETSDGDWYEYLHARESSAGTADERWRHTFGCGQWFIVTRDTRTHEILHSRAIDAHPTGHAR